MDFSRLFQLSKNTYPNNSERTFKYGTAGFREKADDMDFIMFRMGALAALRSCNKNAAVAVMITASHNPIEDNGVKLVDPFGEMLAIDWEQHATSLINASNDDILQEVNAIICQHSIEMGGKALVLIGMDTRPSSKRLKDALICGVEAIGGQVKDFGVITTPILHYIVRCTNDGGKYGEASICGYFKKLALAFTSLREKGGIKGNYSPNIYFDGANGVGSPIMKQMVPYLQKKIDIEIFNKGEGILNSMCGSDFVKSTQQWPNGVPRKPVVRCISVDGDADRILYTYLDKDDQLHMLDGDKIATLIASHLKKLLVKEGLDLKLGLVQTAYANGASTHYITKILNVPVTCTKTGVKYLHSAALEFDIGVYFESNGHGTVVFSDHARELIKKNSASELNNFMNLINETVGDAISDMLVVETVLQSNGWSADDWDKSYTDLAYSLMKIKVADRSIITTANAERTCVLPLGLQDKIDAIVSKYPKGRSFVRPSGTEDIVRIYAESENRFQANQLAWEVANLTFDMAGGVGEIPQMPS